MIYTFLAEGFEEIEALCPVDAAHPVTGGKQQCAHSKLLDTVCVCTRGVEHHDALLCAAVNGNVVDTCTSAGDGKQLGVEGHLVHLGRAHHDTNGCFYLCADVVYVCVKTVRADLGDLVEQLNVLHVFAFLPYALGFSAANFFMKATSASTPS